MALPDQSILAQLEPISMMSTSRLQELVSLSFIEKVSKDIDPLRMNVLGSPQAIYLITGELELHFMDGSTVVLQGGTYAARQALGFGHLKLKETRALTEIEIIRIDLDLLDIMMTWDQLAGYESSAPQATDQAEGSQHATGEWMRETSIFSAGNLQNGVFSRLPPENVEEMFRRMTTMQVKAGQVMITQGAEGDYYYLIKSGTAIVTRIIQPGEPPTLLAELDQGDAFGEEALVSDNKRNATVTMKTDGVLLRLNKTDFIELLKAPLIKQISMHDAKQKLQTSPVWLDVRFPSEYKFDHLPNALNTPLNEIRGLMKTLDRSKQYITYCQTGRRSSAAAFIMIQNGFNALVLEGGTRGAKTA